MLVVLLTSSPECSRTSARKPILSHVEDNLSDIDTTSVPVRINIPETQSLNRLIGGDGTHLYIAPTRFGYIGLTNKALFIVSSDIQRSCSNYCHIHKPDVHLRAVEGNQLDTFSEDIEVHVCKIEDEVCFLVVSVLDYDQAIGPPRKVELEWCYGSIGEGRDDVVRCKVAYKSIWRANFDTPRENYVIIKYRDNVYTCSPVIIHA